MATSSIRTKIDSEITSRIGKWFTVRQIQDKLKVNPATLKPLIMRYAREKLLKRRSVKGTARSVEFTPAASNKASFEKLLGSKMPYRTTTLVKKAAPAKKTTTKRK